MLLQKVRRIMKRQKMKQHKKDEFEARIKMEETAQQEVGARLKAMEAIAENQLRRRGR